MRVQSNWLLNLGDELGTVLGYRIFLEPKQIKNYRGLKFSLIKEYQLALGKIETGMTIFSISKEKKIIFSVLDHIISDISQRSNLTPFETVETEVFEIDLTKIPWVSCASYLCQAIIGKLMAKKEKDLSFPEELKLVYCTDDVFLSDDRVVRYVALLGVHPLVPRNFYVTVEVHSQLEGECTEKSDLYAFSHIREQQKLSSDVRLELIQRYATRLFHPELEFHLGGLHFKLNHELLIQDLKINEVSL